MKKQRLTEKELLLLIQDQSKSTTRFVNKIEIIDKIITERFTTFSGFPLTMYFEECIFLNEFGVVFNKTEVAVSFKHCYFFGQVSFTGAVFTDSLSFINCKLKSSLLILHSTFNELVADFTASKQIICSFDTKFKRMSLSGREFAIFDELYLNLNSIEEKFYASNSNFKKVVINSFSTGLQRDTELEISNCKINSLYFDDINNNGRLKLHNIQALNIDKEGSFLTISKSNLGKAEFFQFDFSSYTEINVLNSFLGDCIFVNTTWNPSRSISNINVFEGKEMKGYLSDRTLRKGHNKGFYKLLWKLFKISPFKETASQLGHKKDIFKQIKFALSKQGDTINEKLFYCLEMTAYNRSLKFNNKTASTKFILFLSKLTSNYGLSLSRPIILILTNILPFYLLVIKDKIPGVHVASFSNSNLHGVLNAIAQFLYMLNPLRKFELDINGSILILDIWIRVISSYAIYNIIRSTRRFIN